MTAPIATEATLSLAQKLDRVEDLAEQMDALRIKLDEARNEAKKQMAKEGLKSAASSSGKVFLFMSWLEADFDEKDAAYADKVGILKHFAPEDKSKWLTWAKVHRLLKQGLISHTQATRLKRGKTPTQVSILKRKPDENKGGANESK